jgi:gliding motility-associated-like protein
MKLTKFNNCGQIQWSKKYDLPNTYNTLTDFISTVNGGFAILTRAYDGNVYTPVITRLNNTGDILWSKNIEDTFYHHYGYTLNVDHHGNFVLWANVCHRNISHYFNMIAKVSGNGSLMWTKFYDHGGTWGGAIVTSDHGILARTGSNYIKTDFNGNVEWSVQLLTSSYNYFAPVEVSDGYIMSGWSNSTSQQIEYYKIDKSGNQMWGGTKITNFAGPPPHLEKLSNGNLMGVFRVMGGVITCIVEFDKDLNVVKQGNINYHLSGMNLYGRDICILSDGTPVIAGLTNGWPSVFYAKLDDELNIECDTVQDIIEITTDTYAHSFIPTNVSTSPFVSINQSYSFDTLNLTNNTLCKTPKFLELGNDTLYCQNETVILENKTGSIFASYEWSTGETSKSITIDKPGKYWVQVSDNCEENSLTDTIEISFKPVATIELGNDYVKCEKDFSIAKGPACSSCTYTWSTGSNADSIVIHDPGTYWLQVENVFGCVSKDTVMVNEFNCECDFYVPNSFTPNDDGKNESFHPVYYCDVKEYSILLFNRWGQMIYSSDQIESSWNGKVKDRNAPEGIYLYVINYTPIVSGIVQDQVTRTGSVALIY